MVVIVRKIVRARLVRANGIVRSRVGCAIVTGVGCIDAAAVVGTKVGICFDRSVAGTCVGVILGGLV